VLTPAKMVSEAGVKLSPDDNHVISTDKEPKDGKDTYRVTVTANWKDVSGFRLEALSGDKLPAHGPGRAADGNFVITEFSLEDAGTNRIALCEATATFEAARFPASAALDGELGTNNGWAIREVSGVEQAIYFRTTEPLTNEEESSLTFVIQQTSGENQVLGRFRLAATTNAGAARAP